MKRPTKRWLIAPLLLAAVALIAAACGNDNDNDELLAEVSALRTEVAQTQQIATEALVRASLPALEVARFHDIDERVNLEGIVHPTDPGFLQRAQQVLARSIWPLELQANVDQFRDAVAGAIDPVLDNDPQAAGRPIQIAHAHAHEFQGAVAAYFAGDPVPPPPDFDSDAEHEHAADEDEDDDHSDDHDDDDEHADDE